MIKSRTKGRNIENIREAYPTMGTSGGDEGDVLIVGAGPVGLLTALALAQTGARVTVIEAATEVSDAPRAAIYFSSTMRILDELGLLDDVAAQSVKGTCLSNHFPAFGERFDFNIDCMRGITYDHQLHAGQDVVARITMDHARRLGVTVLFNHELIGLTQTSDSATATVKTPEGNRDLPARWIIGADGARSTVRHLLGIEFAGFSWPNRFVATNVQCDFASMGYSTANFICDPVYMAVIAVIAKDNLWRLTYQEDTTHPIETFRERLPERYAWFIPQGVPYEIKSANPYVIHQRAATTLRQGRILLTGDAAHVTNPCGGLGLTTGIITGMILSDLLGAVIQGKEDPVILDRYSDERRRIFWNVTSPSASNTKNMLERADPVERRQDIENARALASDPALRRMMMSAPYKIIGDLLRPESRWVGLDRLEGMG
jgi:2-polyprenyl-6-methoxyphenol hydroxylase-like FAD-dependent oxidoreductase